MKKGILLLFVTIFSFNLSSAQNQSDFQNEIESLFGELEKTMQQLEPLINGNLFNQLDTLDISQLGFDPQKFEQMLEGKDLDNLSMDDMMDIMRIQMEMMEDIDLSQFNQLFEGFGLTSPNLPKSFPKSEEREETQPAKKKKKKRKSYKL